MMRWAGLALIAMMPFHVALRPEHGWLLLSTCDVAAMVTAVGLVAGWPAPSASRSCSRSSVGLPAFAIGLFSTYPLNPTGTVIHIVPPLLGGIVVARHGLPRVRALYAWVGYAATFLTGVPGGAGHAQHQLRERRVAAARERVRPLGLFQAALLVVIGLLALGAEWLTRRALAGRRAAPAAPTVAS